LKIIGQNKTGYIGEFTLLELANLVGYRTYSEYHKAMPKTLGVEDEVPISEIFAQINFYAEHQKELGQLALKLEDFAKQIVLIDPIVKGG